MEQLGEQYKDEIMNLNLLSRLLGCRNSNYMKILEKNFLGG